MDREGQAKADPVVRALADLAAAREAVDSAEVEAGEVAAEAAEDAARKADRKGLQPFGVRNASSASESTGFITASTARMETPRSTLGRIRSTKPRHPKFPAGRKPRE